MKGIKCKNDRFLNKKEKKALESGLPMWIWMTVNLAFLLNEKHPVLAVVRDGQESCCFRVLRNWLLWLWEVLGIDQTTQSGLSTCKSIEVPDTFICLFSSCVWPIESQNKEKYILYFFVTSALSLLVQVSFYYPSSLSSKILTCHFSFSHVGVFLFYILKKSYLSNPLP